MYLSIYTNQYIFIRSARVYEKSAIAIFLVVYVKDLICTSNIIIESNDQSIVSG